jgi:hypothetical protein
MYVQFCSFLADGVENPVHPPGHKGWGGRCFSLHFQDSSDSGTLLLDAVNGYGFSFSPWQAECWHWHVSSVTRLASAQVSLQYFFPLAGTQLQAGWAHFDVAVMGFSSFVERALFLRRCLRARLDLLASLR